MARQQGYIVRLAVFIPVNHADMDDVIAKANLVKGLQDGSKLGGVVPERFAVAKTSREDAMEAIGDEGQTDLEEAIDGRDEEEQEQAPAADSKAEDAAVPGFLRRGKKAENAPV